MKHSWLIIVWCIILAMPLFGQQAFKGLSYQAQLLDDFGQVLSERKITLKISLLSKEAGEHIHYTEVHETATDAQGEIALVIGRGRVIQGTFEAIPWADHQIWLDIQWMGQKTGTSKAVVHEKLLSVPYVEHAENASKILGLAEQSAEKSQSINWLIGGNSKTLPPTQFLGTRDNQDFILKTNATPRLIFTKEGQTKVLSGVDGESDSPDAYPLRVGGSHQGIFISVGGSPFIKLLPTGIEIFTALDKRNDFVTFADDYGVLGRIEGQHSSELFSEPALFIGHSVFLGLLGWHTYQLKSAITAEEAKTVSYAACDFASGGALGTILSSTGKLIALIGLKVIETLERNKIIKDVGVTYESGAGDYAEWLERAPGSSNLRPGEVVGVRAGKVSRNTEIADHYMVVSTRPAVLGNTPVPEQKERYEPIAFMGQVPVQVVGQVRAGDFILPSGNNDGYGIGVAPEHMQTGDFPRIIGVAWENTPEASVHSFVNTAIGINSNDLARKLDVLNQKVHKILAYLEGKGTLEAIEMLEEVAPDIEAPQTKLSKGLSDIQFDQLVDQFEPLVLQCSHLLLDKIEAGNYSEETKMWVKRFAANPIINLKLARRDPKLYSIWAYLDVKIKILFRL